MIHGDPRPAGVRHGLSSALAHDPTGHRETTIEEGTTMDKPMPYDAKNKKAAALVTAGLMEPAGTVKAYEPTKYDAKASEGKETPKKD